MSTIWSALLTTPFELGYVEVGGIATRRLSAGRGEPLILLHGTGGHLEAFAQNIAELSRHYQVIAYDMLGHGFTDKPDMPYTVEHYCRHLLGLMDAHGLESAHISGESLGGWVAAWTAAHHPDRVRSLFLNTPGNVTNKESVMRSLTASSLRAVREASLETVRARVEWLFHDTSRVTDELVETRYRIYTQPGFAHTMENILALQDPEIRRHFSWSEDWVSRISCPTYVLWTSHDPSGAVEEGRLLQSWIDGAGFGVIDDAGHWPQWERPEEFNRLLVDFVAGRLAVAGAGAGS